jgi:uncharacterized protein YbjT (DUF2867 family)
MGLVAAIAGASGLVGGCALSALLTDAAYDRVVSLVRRPLDGGGSKLVQAIVDFNHLEDAETWAEVGPVDVVFCCLGTTLKVAGSRAAFRDVDYVYPMKLAECGRRAGARRFLVVSSVGANAQSSAFYLRIKGELERDLGLAGFESLSIFRPSLLLGDRKEKRFGERLAQAVYPVVNPFLIGGLRKYRAIDARTVGQAMASRGIRQAQGTSILLYDDIQALAAGGIVA